ncbi:MAG TPA: hypothetical protein VGB12_01570, partial [bacterium]
MSGWSGRRTTSLLPVVVLIAVLLPCAATAALPSSAEIRVYLDGVRALAQEIPEPAGDDESIKAYLEGCAQRAASLLRLADAQPPDTLAIRAALRSLKDYRNRQKDSLGPLTDLGRGLLQAENRGHWPPLATYLDGEYLQYLVVKRELLERKYFEEDDPAQANLLEGWINGRFDL